MRLEHGCYPLFLCRSVVERAIAGQKEIKKNKHAQFGEKKSTRNFKVVARTRAEKEHLLKGLA